MCILLDRYHSIQPNLDRIKDTDESMANFLGVTFKGGRVKRFWAEIGSFFKRIGGAVVRTIFGGGASNVDLSAYNRAISDLQNGQRELSNEIQLQRTIFMIDSEKKNVEINRLGKAQVDIENKLTSLESIVEKDKAEKEKEIKELQGMLSEVKDKIKAQEENQKILNGRVDKIEKNLLNINNDIKEIKDNIAENTKDIDTLKVISKLNVISTNFILLMDQFKTEQLILFGVIKNANSGQLDPYILTPSQLVEMLGDIQQDLPEGTKFPYYPNIKNAKKLYNIIKPSVYLFNYKIIFILNIPLVYSKTFNLHKITSLPVSVGGNKYVFILPQEPFMIIDNNYQDYMLMSKDNFKDFCSEREKTKHICQQTEEILHSQYLNECEVNLFKSPRQIPETCDKRIMSLDKPMFLQLQQVMSWIYVVPGIENVIIDCGVNRTTIPFQGTGFIRIKGKCSVLTNNFQLRSLTTFTNPVESDYSPPLNLTDFVDLTQFDEITMKDVKSIQTIFPFDIKKLEDISYKISKNKVDLTALYCTLAVLAVLVCVIVYLIYKKKISLDTFRNIRNFMNSRKQPPSHPEGGSDPEGIKMRIQVKNREDIKKVSVHESPSETDPDSEYLTVRFKVKKDKCAASTSPDKIICNKLNPPKNNLTPKENNEEKYLSELRKLKPNPKK